MPKRQRFEYAYWIHNRNWTHSSCSVLNELNRAGQDGWEAVCAVDEYRVLLKRPVDDLTAG